MEYATYQITEAVNGAGTFFFTDCCRNRMYSINGPDAYHGKLCPACMVRGKMVILYKRGTPEANEVMKKRGVRSCFEVITKCFEV